MQCLTLSAGRLLRRRFRRRSRTGILLRSGCCRLLLLSRLDRCLLGGCHFISLLFNDAFNTRLSHIFKGMNTGVSVCLRYGYGGY